MKNFGLKMIIGILIMFIITYTVITTDRTSSRSGSMELLAEYGQIEMTEGVLIYHYYGEITEEELKSLARLSQVFDFVYLRTINDKN